MHRTDPVAELRRLGQSVWLDHLDRRMIVEGGLERYRNLGVTGVTANPTIFAKALEGSDAYGTEIGKRLGEGHKAEDVLWELLVEDVRSAADILRPVFDSTGGADGFVSIEVSPLLAGETPKTIMAARKLLEGCVRRNVMVKIPATPAGLPAIRTMVAEGANVNVTLIFSVERYVHVVEAFLCGLEDLSERGGDLSCVRSVASFFVSRVDTKVDEELGSQIEHARGEDRRHLESLLGRAGIANCKVAYTLFEQLHSGPRWEALSADGAAVQRCLWASTSTKNPRYRDTMYVEELIGPATVNTMPPATFDAFREHGRAELTLQKDVEGAKRTLDRLAVAGVDLGRITHELEQDGVAAFADSYRKSLERLPQVRARS